MKHFSDDEELKRCWKNYLVKHGDYEIGLFWISRNTCFLIMVSFGNFWLLYFKWCMWAISLAIASNRIQLKRSRKKMYTSCSRFFKDYYVLKRLIKKDWSKLKDLKITIVWNNVESRMARRMCHFTINDVAWNGFSKCRSTEAGYLPTQVTLDGIMQVLLLLPTYNPLAMLSFSCPCARDSLM